MELGSLTVGLLLGVGVATIRNRRRMAEYKAQFEKEVAATSHLPVEERPKVVDYYNDKDLNNARLMDSSEYIELKLAEMVDESEFDDDIVEYIIKEIPNMAFTKTYNLKEKDWLSRPLGKVLITEDRDRNNDKVCLYIGTYEVEMEHHQQMRLINALITVRNNSFNIPEGK